MAASEETKDTVAQVGFMAFMAAAMGPVGIIVAALAVGAERAWNGDGGRPASQDVARQRVADERQWLAEDRAWRQAQRDARRRWLDDDKADPAKEPARPSTAEAAGRWWRRLWARMVVFTDDFQRGFRDGWVAAKKARDNGADWRETARTRPEPEGLDIDRVEPGGGDGEWPRRYDPKPVAPQPEPDVDLSKVKLWPGPGGYTDTTKPAPATDQTTEPEPDNTDEGDTPMTVTANGPSNVDILAKQLGGIGRDTTHVDNHVDELDKLAASLARQVQQAADHAEATGQATAAKASLDAARAMVAKLKALVAAVSAAAAATGEATSQATSAAKRTKTQQDDIESTGARGDAVATAKAA